MAEKNEKFEKTTQKARLSRKGALCIRDAARVVSTTRRLSFFAGLPPLLSWGRSLTRLVRKHFEVRSGQPVVEDPARRTAKVQLPRAHLLPALFTFRSVALDAFQFHTINVSQVLSA